MADETSSPTVEDMSPGDKWLMDPILASKNPEGETRLHASGGPWTASLPPQIGLMWVECFEETGARVIDVTLPKGYTPRTYESGDGGTVAVRNTFQFRHGFNVHNDPARWARDAIAGPAAGVGL